MKPEAERASIDIDQVIAETRLLLPEISLLWEHSGGGCGTLYVGDRYRDPAYPDEWFWPVMVGPGSYYDSTLHGSECCVGWDQDQGHDGGGWTSAERPAPIARPARIALEVAAWYRDHPRFDPASGRVV